MIRPAALLVLTVAALLGRQVFDRALHAPELVLTAGPPTECVSAAEIVADQVLYVNGMVRLPLCSPGVLRFTLSGTAVHGQGAHAHVTVGPEVHWDGEVIEARHFAVPLNAPAWITISFLNDRREGPDDRNLWISDLGFEAY
jgi:hypothetical protein